MWEYPESTIPIIGILAQFYLVKSIVFFFLVSNIYPQRLQFACSVVFSYFVELQMGSEITNMIEAQNSYTNTVC